MADTQVKEKVIEIQNLHKAFGKNEVLKGIDLDVYRGENVAVLGRSGTGKSVLIKCIVGLIWPDKGRVCILGNNLLDMEEEDVDNVRKKVGYLFQGGALYDSMSVRQNLEFPIRRTQQAKNKKEINKLVCEALDNVGLLDAVDKMPSELSGGQRKRIGLARTLILKPEIILYDEPTTGLDPVTSSEISGLIVEIQKKYNTTSVIVTHDLKCTRIAANKIVLLRDGMFYKSGQYDELANSEDDSVRAYFD